MAKKISDWTSDKVGHKFLEYVLKKNIHSKINKKMKGSFYINTALENDKYDKFFRQEYYRWARKNKIPNRLIEAGLESYISD